MSVSSRGFGLSRRTFLHSAGALAVASQANWWLRSLLAQDLRTADQVIAGKNAGLIVHNDKVGEIETPLKLLSEHRITPKDILFVRNNQVLPGYMTTATPEPKTWMVELFGLIEQPAQISLFELSEMETVEHVMVLQCSGNGRSRFSQAAKVKGAQWSTGAMGNIRVKGIPLKAVCEKLKVTPDAKARYLTAEGMDGPEKPEAPDFEHSLPLDVALERSLLVTHMNGEPLPAVHGGPVRLMTPGFYGTMHVKWVTRLRFEAGESTNYNHVPRYRTPNKLIAPGAEFDATLTNSEPNWNMKIKSVFFTPGDNDVVRAGQKVPVTGVAWNDGTAKIHSVDVSLDNGESWQAAKINPMAGPYAWHAWRIDLPLKPGRQTLLVRATDALGRTQPRDGQIYWNPGGYTWNGVEAITIDVVA